MTVGLEPTTHLANQPSALPTELNHRILVRKSGIEPLHSRLQLDALPFELLSHNYFI